MADRVNAHDADVYVRMKHIIKGDPERGIRPIFPVSDAQIYRAIAAGWFPAGIKLSPKVTVYRLSDVLAALDKKYAEAKSNATPELTRE